MGLKEILRSAKFILPTALGLWSGANAFSQTTDQVRIQGTVQDTSGHSVENANVKIWKAEDPSIYQLTETDFNGEYLQDISTAVELPSEDKKKPVNIINNGTSDKIGITGRLSQRPKAIEIFNNIGQLIKNIPFTYDPASQEVRATWQSDKPGLYFANIISNNNKETLKFITTNTHQEPILNLPAQTNTLKSAFASDPIKYYIEISADGNEPIMFTTIRDSIEANGGDIVYPTDIVTPIIPAYTAPIQGQVTLAGNNVGPHFKIVLSPQGEQPQELYTDENGQFSTTITIPPQAYPYNSATITLNATAEPTSTSIQTTNANQDITITNTNTPYELSMAVDSAWIHLLGSVLPENTNARITVNGREIFHDNIATTYDLGKTNTLQDSSLVEYLFSKYHYQDKTITKKVGVWDTLALTTTLPFIPAEYTATITSDDSAHITITKKDTDETLWKYTSSGIDTLPALQRTELDSMQVELRAQKTGEHTFDTIFSLYELQPNNISFSMQDSVIIPPTYFGRALGFIEREDGGQLYKAKTTFILDKDTLQQFINIASTTGVYLLDSLPTDADGEIYDITIEPTANSPPFLTYHTSVLIKDGDNRNDFLDVKKIPQTIDFIISTYNEKDSTALSNVLISYYTVGSDGFTGTSDDEFVTSTTSQNGHAIIENMPTGTNGYFKAKMTSANADEYFKYDRANYDTPNEITLAKDTTANVLFLMVEKDQRIPGTNNEHLTLPDATQIRTRQGQKTNAWSMRGKPYELSTAILKNDDYGTITEKIAQLQRIIHNGDSLLYDGRTTIVLVNKIYPGTNSPTRSRADPYTTTGQQVLDDSLGFYADVGNNITETAQNVVYYHGLNGFNEENGQILITDGSIKVAFYDDVDIQKEIFFRLRGREYYDGSFTPEKRAKENLIDRLERKVYTAFYNDKTTSYTARYLYNNDE